MKIVEISGLTKSFKNLPALRDITISVYEGEIFGIIGPDGAGKTTLLRTLSGILPPDSGDIQIQGIDVNENPEDIKDKVGVMPQKFSLYPDLSVEENIWFFSKMFDVDEGLFETRKQKLLQISRLTPFLKRKAVHLSGGMQKKLALICSLLHTPSLLLLDEPTTGVDPVSRREFWDFLNELLTEGITIIVSTPYMDEAERCTRIAFLYGGEILLIEEPLKLKGNYRYEILELKSKRIESLRVKDLKIDGLKDIYPVGNAMHLVFEKAEPQRIKEIYQNYGFDVEIKRMEPSFEDVFISVINEYHRNL